MYEIKTSELDKSINFIRKVDIGVLEARRVQRVKDKLSIYLSSQTGCNQSCRMCHLTSSGQNKFRDATREEILSQYEEVSANCDFSGVSRVHLNFMARGEPLSSGVILDPEESVLEEICQDLISKRVSPRVCISTIMPKTFEGKSLKEVFPTILPEIYYSLYSLDENKRKRWLPKAMCPFKALEKLKSWQEWSNKIPKIHFPFIKGFNDDEEGVRDIVKAINSLGLKVNVNIPAYNPNKFGGVEAEESVINRNVEILSEGLECEVKIIPRVGFDVKASCGMFVGQ